VAHPYRIRDIALQSGLSEATIDRVLNRRGQVRASTVAEVEQAIADLDRQRSQLRLSGRTFIVDVVVQAPERFSTAVKAALEAELPTLRPGVVRSRFHRLPGTDPAEVVEVLDGLAQRRSQGVILKAPDVPEVVASVGRLAKAGIPVVTLVTDLPASARIGYSGLDNAAAGATAAFLIDHSLGGTPGDILVTRGMSSFHGEQERDRGFSDAIAHLSPDRQCVGAVERTGDDQDLAAQVEAALLAYPSLSAVYSMYSFASGNRATVEAFQRAGRACRVFVAHDLDAENLSLLHEGLITFVLDHDLHLDLRRACQMITHSHIGRPIRPLTRTSGVAVMTRYNLPKSSAQPIRSYRWSSRTT
jgi:LacI family transcriptional regulator